MILFVYVFDSELKSLTITDNRQSRKWVNNWRMLVSPFRAGQQLHQGTAAVMASVDYV